MQTAITVNMLNLAHNESTFYARHALKKGVTLMSLPTNSSAILLSTVAASLSPEQRATWLMQSQSSFAQTDLLNPSEDVWNDA
jgi:hypothetical protein